MLKRLLPLALVGQVHAHHGQDFLVALDPRVPDAGAFTSFISTEWTRAGRDEEFLAEPGILAGLGHGFAVGTSVSFAEDESTSWGYAGITPTIQWSAACPNAPFRFGFAAGYHFADGNTHVSSHHHEDEETLGAIAIAADEAHESEEAGHSHSDHRGIHRHGEDHFNLRLIGEAQLAGDTKVVANLIAVGSSSDDIDLGYALGVRRPLCARTAVGVEAIGDFNPHGEHELIAGLYFTPSHELALRIGIGAGIGSGSPDTSVLAGGTWRF